MHRTAHQHVQVHLLPTLHGDCLYDALSSNLGYIKWLAAKCGFTFAESLEKITAQSVHVPDFARDLAQVLSNPIKLLKIAVLRQRL